MNRINIKMTRLTLPNRQFSVPHTCEKEVTKYPRKFFKKNKKPI